MKTKIVLDKVYDKNGNEIPQGYQIEECPELSEFLTGIVQRLIQQKQTNKSHNTI